MNMFKPLSTPLAKDDVGTSHQYRRDDMIGSDGIRKNTDKVRDHFSMWFYLLKYILEDESATCKLGKMLYKIHDVMKDDKDIRTMLPKRNIQMAHKKRRKRSCQEFWLDAQVHGYDIKNAMLDLGCDINML